jgi:hypothetical protein
MPNQNLEIPVQKSKKIILRAVNVVHIHYMYQHYHYLEY